MVYFQVFLCIYQNNLSGLHAEADMRIQLFLIKPELEIFKNVE